MSNLEGLLDKNEEYSRTIAKYLPNLNEILD